MRRTSALIVGGGPAGAVAAMLLARAGAEHLLLERNVETGDALCGGFLSWRTLDTLSRLGIDPADLNPAEVGEVRLFAGALITSARLPRPARAVSRRRLDSLLLARAARDGAAIERGAVAVDAQGDTIRLRDGGAIGTPALFLATGKHELRGLARPDSARGNDPSLGLRVRLGPSPGLDRLVGAAIELHLFDAGYAGLVRQEDGAINLCMAVHRSRLAGAGSPEALLAAIGRESPALGERLSWRSSGSGIDAVANVPYGWRAKRGVGGLFRLGDQAGVISSLAGEGMGIALASAVRAAQAYLRGGPAASIAFQERLARDLARPIGIATLIRRAAESPRVAPWLIRGGSAAPALIPLVARLTRIGHSPIDGSDIAQENRA